MDTSGLTSKTKCPDCSRPYQIKSILPQMKGNFPLLLRCGHTMCETCIRNNIKVRKPIHCKFCKKDMEVDEPVLHLVTHKKSALYQKFPVNNIMFAEILLQVNTTARPLNQEDCYIDLKELIKTTETSKGHCFECRVGTNKMCMQCAEILCDNCFNISHKDFATFKNHVLQPIGISQTDNACKIHKMKPIEYYCKDCNKAICIVCTFVGAGKSCKNHDVVALNDMNKAYINELIETAPAVDEVLKRLTKTAVDVGDLIQSLQSDSDAEHTKIIYDIDQHFSKITLALQQHKNELMDTVNQVIASEIESLRNIQTDIKCSIKKAKDILNSIDITIQTNCPQGNIADLLEEAKLVANTPWYLDKIDSIKEPSKLEVNDNLCTLVKNYVHLHVNLKTEYKLCSTKDIKEGTEIPSPPKAIVYPPKLTEDEGHISKRKPSNIKPRKGIYKDVLKDINRGESNSSVKSVDSNNSENKAYVTSFNKLAKTTEEQQQNNEPIPFEEGTQELVYISHIIDPNHFYVQRASHHDLIKLMLRDFRYASSLPQPAPNHVTEGKYYLAYSQVDNMWQRCRILSVDKNDTGPCFKVFYIDFGSTEVVQLDKLRLLPLSKENQFPLAVKCSLANCAPKHGGWSLNDSLLIQNIINGKQAVIHVRNLRIDNNSDVTIDCDLTTLEEGISIAHALVFHERGNLIEPQLPYPKPKFLMEEAKLIVGKSDFKEKAIEGVYITCIVSPDRFFVIKQHVQSVYEKLAEDLEHEYKMGPNTGSIYLPEVGMACAVKLEKSHDRGASAAGGEGAEEGAGWARGVVHELLGGGRVRVALPDSGATMLVHWTRLKYLHHKFTTLAALASECHLANVTPLSNKWSTGSVGLLHTFKDKLLELHVEDTSRSGSIGVTLFDNLDEENIICINQEMINNKFAISFGLYNCNEANPSIKEEQLYTNQPDEMAQPKPKEKQINMLNKYTNAYVAAKPHTEEHNLDAIDKGPIRLEAQVLNYQSPSLFYISFVYQQEKFNTLYDNIQAYYSKNDTKIKVDWKEGDRCCTLCNLSQTWRRAYILAIEEENAKIFFSDFAVTAKVPLPNLRELTPEFTKHCYAAIKCHLCGVMPATGNEWAGLTKEYFKELLDAYPCLFITKHGKFENNSMPVEIWAYHVTQNVTEWRCLNYKIIEQGLGVRDKSVEASANKDKDNVTDDIHGKDLVIEEEQQKILKYPGYTEKKLLCNISVVNCAEMLELNIINNDETNLLYEQVLEKLRKEYHTMPIINDVIENKACIALFHEDNEWYRASILQYDDAKQLIKVRFVDYGNIEVVPRENIRDIDVEWVKLPPTCVSVKLHGIDVNPEIEMDVILEYYTETFIEKGPFYSKLIDYENDIPRVELLNDKGELVYQNLVEEGIFFKY